LCKNTTGIFAFDQVALTIIEVFSDLPISGDFGQTIFRVEILNAGLTILRSLDHITVIIIGDRENHKKRDVIIQWAIAATIILIIFFLVLGVITTIQWIFF